MLYNCVRSFRSICSLLCILPTVCLDLHQLIPLVFPAFLACTWKWNCSTNSGEISPSFLTKSSFSLSLHPSNQLVKSFIWHWNILGGLSLTLSVFILSKSESTSGGTPLLTRSVKKSICWYLLHVVNQWSTVRISLSWTENAIPAILLQLNCFWTGGSNNHERDILYPFICVGVRSISFMNPVQDLYFVGIIVCLIMMLCLCFDNNVIIPITMMKHSGSAGSILSRRSMQCLHFTAKTRQTASRQSTVRRLKWKWRGDGKYRARWNRQKWTKSS